MNRILYILFLYLILCGCKDIEFRTPLMNNDKFNDYQPWWLTNEVDPVWTNWVPRTNTTEGIFYD